MNLCGTPEVTGSSRETVPSRVTCCRRPMMIGAVSLRSLAGISSGPVAFSGFNASRID